MCDFVSKDFVGELKTIGVCENCGRDLKEREATVFDKVFHFKIRCQCMEDLEKQEKQEKLDMQKECKIKECINFSNIGDRLNSCSFENYIVNDQNKGLFNASKLYAFKFDNFYKKGLGMVVFGNPGNGKSHLSVAIFKELIKQNKEVVFIKATSLLTKMNEARNFNSNESISEIVNKLSNIDLLILDDLGTHKWSNENLDYLYKIIDSRYSNMKPIIISTNINADELKLCISERIYDRLSGCCSFINNTAPSHRPNEAINSFQSIQL